MAIIYEYLASYGEIYHGVIRERLYGMKMVDEVGMGEVEMIDELEMVDEVEVMDVVGMVIDHVVEMVDAVVCYVILPSCHPILRSVVDEP